MWDITLTAEKILKNLMANLLIEGERLSGCKEQIEAQQYGRQQSFLAIKHVLC